jgi:hypothetical protein
MWHALKFLVKPTWRSNYVQLQKVRTWGLLLTSSTKRGKRGVLEVLGLDYEDGQLCCYMILHPKTNPKLVRTHFASIWCWDKPRATLDSLDSPRPELGGSHHLPPYNILYVTSREPHPNGTFSWDSQGRVPKLSWVGLPGLWTLISPGSDLRLEWSLNQSCSSPRELFNALSHAFCRCREEVDSRLLMVRSQTGNLTPDPSFAYNLGCRCPNGSCEAILDI